MTIYNLLKKRSILICLFLIGMPHIACWERLRTPPIIGTCLQRENHCLKIKCDSLEDPYECKEACHKTALTCAQIQGRGRPPQKNERGSPSHPSLKALIISFKDNISSEIKQFKLLHILEL